MKIRKLIASLVFGCVFAGSAFAAYEKELLAACENGSSRNARIYLQRGADPNAAKQDGNFTYTALCYACKNKKLDLVKDLVECGADVDVADENYISPIAIAASVNNKYIVDYLLSKGASVNGRDVDGNTAFMNIIKMNDIGLFYKACDNGAEANLYNNAGHTPLSYAVKTGDSRMIRGLVGPTKRVDIAANINHYIDSEECTIVEYSLRQQSIDALRTLLSVDFDSTKQDSEGLPILCWAIKNRISWLMISELIDKAPDCVDGQDSSGYGVDYYLVKYPSTNTDKIKYKVDEIRARNEAASYTRR